MKSEFLTSDVSFYATKDVWVIKEIQMATRNNSSVSKNIIAPKHRRGGQRRAHFWMRLAGDADALVCLSGFCPCRLELHPSTCCRKRRSGLWCSEHNTKHCPSTWRNEPEPWNRKVNCDHSSQIALGQCKCWFLATIYPMLPHARCSMCCISFIPHNPPVKEIILLPVYRWRDWTNSPLLNYSVEWPGLKPVFGWSPGTTCLSLANFLRAPYAMDSLSGGHIGRHLNWLAENCFRHSS